LKNIVSQSDDKTERNNGKREIRVDLAARLLDPPPEKEREKT